MRNDTNKAATISAYRKPTKKPVAFDRGTVML
jgi:hypothetical protein